MEYIFKILDSFSMPFVYFATFLVIIIFAVKPLLEFFVTRWAAKRKKILAEELAKEMAKINAAKTEQAQKPAADKPQPLTTEKQPVQQQ